MNNLKTAYRESADNYDRWGSAMAAYFTVACEISYRGDNVPAKWGFRPAPTEDCREHDDYMFEVAEQSSTADLVRFGNVLERYTRNLDRIGESY